MRRHLTNAVAIAFIVGLLSIAVEYAYRLYLVDTYVHARFGVTLVDRLFEIEDIRRRRAGDGLYLPGLNIRHRLFDVDHRLLVESTIETNAQGYRSAFDYPPPGEGEFRIAVLGDMLELGPGAAAEHARLLEWVTERYAAHVIVVGEQMMAVSHGLGVTPLADAVAARAFLNQRVSPDDWVLLKASRGIALEGVIPGPRDNH